MADLTREQIAWNAGRDAAKELVLSLNSDSSEFMAAWHYAAKKIRALQAPEFNQPAPPADVVDKVSEAIDDMLPKLDGITIHKAALAALAAMRELGMIKEG